MMVGRIGRDKDSFNCGGHHGLTRYNAPFSGLSCDFCKGPIPAGSLASGCRHGFALAVVSYPGIVFAISTHTVVDSFISVRSLGAPSLFSWTCMWERRIILSYPRDA